MGEAQRQASDQSGRHEALQMTSEPAGNAELSTNRRLPSALMPKAGDSKLDPAGIHKLVTNRVTNRG